MASKRYQLNEVAIRMVDMPPLMADYPLDKPEAVCRLMSDTLSKYDREAVAMINLNNNLNPINMNIVSIGTLNSSLISPREAMKSAILSNAYAFVLVHNHPSGRLVPSTEDIEITDKLSRVGNLLGIRLLDHIIVGNEKSYYSFMEKDEIPIHRLSFARRIEDLNLEVDKVAEDKNSYKSNMEVTYTVAECGEYHNLGAMHENIKTAEEAVEIMNSIPNVMMPNIPAIGVRLQDTNNPDNMTEVDIATKNNINLTPLQYYPEIADNYKAQAAIAKLIHAMPGAEIVGEIPEPIAKKVKGLEAADRQQAQLKEITEKLEQGVQDVFNSDNYKEFLKMMAKMPHYSVNNTILIAMQTGGKASLCQSFTGWKKMGRFVKKGEKGIKIIAPAPYTIRKEVDKIDERTGKRMLDKDGEPIKEVVETRFTSFKVEHTFDVSQTDGAELPSIAANELTGDVEQYNTFFKALEQTCPVPISFENIEGGAKGYFSNADNRIAIKEGMSEVQTIKTAIHEMAHQKLHSTRDDGSEVEKDRNQKEVEAESVAFVVCSHYGIDTGDYSFGYVAGWSDGKETPELKASLDTIRSAASEMITAIDEKMEVLTADKEQAAEVEASGRPLGYVKILPSKEDNEALYADRPISIHAAIAEGKAEIAKADHAKTSSKKAEVSL